MKIINKLFIKAKPDPIKEYFKKIIVLYFKHFQKMPSNQWLIEKLNNRFSDSEISTKIQELINEKFLLYQNGIYLLNPQKNIKIIKKGKTETSKLLNKWIHILRYCLLAIGIGAAYMSIFYSYRWLLDFLDSGRAFLLSFIMVVFAIGAFELILFFRQRKLYYLVFVFSILWIIVTFFSMISTVAGQYNARMEAINNRYQNEQIHNKYSQEKESYSEQEKELKEKLDILKQDIFRYQGLLTKYDSPDKIKAEKREYNSLQWYYRFTERKMKEIENKLSGIRNLKLSQKEEKRGSPDFYLWLAGMWGLRPEKIQFWLSIFPAIFIDLIAPLSFAVVMFVEE